MLLKSRDLSLSRIDEQEKKDLVKNGGRTSGAG
jgi:hypothetical protein